MKHQSNNQFSNSIVFLATNNQDISEYMAEDTLCYNSFENRCYFSSFVAYIVSNCNESLAQEYHNAVNVKRESSDYGLENLRTIPQAAREVPPKDYAPEQLLDDVSEVLRALARIVNALSNDRVQLAYDITQRITWLSTKRVILAGIYGACLKVGDKKLATEIFNSLRLEKEITQTHPRKRLQTGIWRLKGLSVSRLFKTAQGNAVLFDMDNDGDIVNASKVYEGCIGVVPWASPDISIIIDDCAGIIAERGALWGHTATAIRMASKCGIFNVYGATRVIKDGYFISIDDDTVEVIAK